VEPTDGDEPPASGRLAFSRPFAQAGFTRAESEAWRRAGWSDPAEAARWKHLAAHHSPGELLDLARSGLGPEDVVVEIDLRDRVRQNLRR
jgi:hypothetical protein